MNTLRSLYVFDLDGVITHPHDSSVDDKAVSHIARLLDQDCHIAVNTGRSYEWVREHFLKRLVEASTAREFDRLFIACEKGGESIEWQDHQFRPQPSRFALADDIHDTVHHFFKSHASLFPTMFWDRTKTTMATIEKHPNADLDQFKAEQSRLVGELQSLLAGNDVRIDPTTIATDVESPQAGKHAGAELIHEWAASQPAADHDAYISFGDSKSDYEMARYFAASGSKSIFVFVGASHETFDEHTGVTLTRTKSSYANGTNEYFASI